MIIECGIRILESIVVVVVVLEGMEWYSLSFCFVLEIPSFSILPIVRNKWTGLYFFFF